MPRNEKKLPRRFLGQVRQSKLTQNFGPGAIVDFVLPGTNQLISGVVGCLEDWDYCAPFGAKGLKHPQAIFEPKLQHHCGVKGFRLPPIRPEHSRGDDDTLPIYLFPTWLQCPKCSRLMPHTRWKRSNDLSKAGYHCSQESCSSVRGKPQPVIPVWLVTACTDGHLGDFPWQRWIGCTCPESRGCLLTQQRGVGLAGRFVKCTNPKCPGHKGRSMRDAFSPIHFKEVMPRCEGNSPHLGARDKPCFCKRRAHVVQRNASNVYWGVTESTLHIPSISSRARNALEAYRDKFADAPEEAWPEHISFLKLEDESGLTTQEICAYYKDTEFMDVPIQAQEYRMLMGAMAEPVNEQDLVALSTDVAPEVSEYFDAVILVPRLKEINALRGFTRITPATGAFSGNSEFGRLSHRNLNWLPASVARGEGIFLVLDEARLLAWENSQAVLDRIALLEKKIEARRGQQGPPPRWILLHTLSHALIKLLGERSGYSSSSLTERIYGNPEIQGRGILIYTGSSDANGTLGGLVRQGLEEAFDGLLHDAIEDMSWCSSDPLCVMEPDILSDPANLAACHACVLLSESSCRHFNQYLDRALLVGTPECPEVGFFHSR